MVLVKKTDRAMDLDDLLLFLNKSGYRFAGINGLRELIQTNQRPAGSVVVTVDTRFPLNSAPREIGRPASDWIYWNQATGEMKTGIMINDFIWPAGTNIAVYSN